MADTDQGEKTEEPTQQRREDFRKRGQVAQTKELGSVLAILASLTAIWFLSGFFLDQLRDVFHMALGKNLVAAVRGGDFIASFKFAAEKTLLIVSPIAAIMWVVSFASSVVQIGFLTNEEALQFKIEKINPVAGLKRLFSIRSVVEGLKAVFKVTIVAAIVYLVIQTEILTIPKLTTYSVEQIFIFLGELFFKLFGGVGFFMVVLAGLDYMFQRWELEKQMRMTKQEVKEEHKSREGDPLIKARIRRVQREMSQRRMMNDVPKADVVITNPTHIAVALSYTKLMTAPTIVAMGAGLIAEKIKDVAKDNKVPIVENKPLARAMYKSLKIGQVIPKELYTAVAEVLSYVFKLKRKKSV